MYLGLSRVTSSIGIEKRVIPFYLMAFFVTLGISVVAPVVPELKAYFNVSYGEAGFMVSAFALTSWILDLPLSFIADRVKKSHLLIVGTFMVVAGSVSAGSSLSFLQLVASRIVTGAGYSICVATSMISLSHLAGRHNRGRVMSLYLTTSLTAATFSPAIGGVITSAFGWRWAFYFCAAAAFVSLISVLVTRPDTDKAAPVSPALEEPRPDGARVTRGETGFSLAMVSVFLAAFAFYFARFGFMQVLVPFYGNAVLGLNTGVIGLVLALSSIAMAVSMLGGGGLADKYGRRLVLTPAALLVAAGSLWFLNASDLGTFIAAVVLVSIGGVGQGIAPIMIGDLSATRVMSRNIGLFRFTADFGIFASPFMLAMLLDHYGFGVPVFLLVGLILPATILVNVVVRASNPKSRTASELE